MPLGSDLRETRTNSLLFLRTPRGRTVHQGSHPAVGGLSNLVGGCEKIPIPKLNEVDFEWTVSTSKSALGEEEYQRHFRLGATWSLGKVASFALSRSANPRVD